MSYLLDTCVVSELTKKQSNQNVVNWIRKIEEEHLFLSVLTLGKIEKGIAKLPLSKPAFSVYQVVTSRMYKRYH